MLKIRLFCVGTIKESFYKEAINEYVKRLSKFAKLEIIELEESKLVNENTLDVINKEGDNLVKRLKKEEYLLILDVKSKEYDSIEFSNLIKNFVDNGTSPINMFIGGTFGISEKVKQRANSKISLSKMTFTHQMTRVILLEQLYRAFKIINNEQYHH